MIIYEMMSWDQVKKTHLIPWGNLDPISIMNSVGKGKRPLLPTGNQNMLNLMVKTDYELELFSFNWLILKYRKNVGLKKQEKDLLLLKFWDNLKV